MLFPDYHFHTDFSSDCDEPMQAVIASAKEKGLSALCVTDHYDMDFPVRSEEPDVDFDLDLIPTIALTTLFLRSLSRNLIFAWV